MKPIYTSFFTKNTLYEEEARNLYKSLKKFDLEPYLLGLESTGDWYKNTHMKPAHLLFVLDLFKGRPVIWLDSDATVEQYPTLFDNISTEDYDIAYHLCKNPGGPVHLLTGTLWFNNNQKCRDLLRLWSDRCKNIVGKSDQDVLMTCIQECNLRVFSLPSSYVKIFDLDETGEKNVKPVISHWQASRRGKKCLDN